MVIRTSEGLVGATDDEEEGSRLITLFFSIWDQSSTSNRGWTANYNNFGGEISRGKPKTIAKEFGFT